MHCPTEYAEGGRQTRLCDHRDARLSGFRRDGRLCGRRKGQAPALHREELWELYRPFGPDEAIAVHRESMSYIVQLAEGYRLFALNDDSNGAGKSGFSEECFAWIAEQARKAREEGQFIIAMTHHPCCPLRRFIQSSGRGI